MKKLLITLLALMIFGATNAQAQFTPKDFDAILEEYKNNSKAFFTNRLSDDFRYINSEGKYQTRADIIAGDAQKIISTEVLQRVIFQSGDLAVVSGIHSTVRPNGKGGTSTGQAACTYAFQQRNGKWMFVSSQHTPIPPAPLTEAEFMEFSNKFVTDPISVLTTRIDPKMKFVFGTGQTVTTQQIIDNYTHAFSEKERHISGLQIQQFGNTAVATGQLASKANPTQIQVWKGTFTYVFAPVNGQWMMVGGQHTDLPEKK